MKLKSTLTEEEIGFIQASGAELLNSIDPRVDRKVVDDLEISSLLRWEENNNSIALGCEEDFINIVKENT